MTNKQKCPICKQATDTNHLPFCSARCQLIDLNKWLSGNYYIPGSDEEDLQSENPNA